MTNDNDSQETTFLLSATNFCTEETVKEKKADIIDV